MCLICMKYMIILIIIVKKLGEILLSYIANAGNNKRMPTINIVKTVRIQSMWHRCQHQRTKKRERADERA